MPRSTRYCYVQELSSFMIIIYPRGILCSRNEKEMFVTRALVLFIVHLNLISLFFRFIHFACPVVMSFFQDCPSSQINCHFQFSDFAIMLLICRRYVLQRTEYEIRGPEETPMLHKSKEISLPCCINCGSRIGLINHSRIHRTKSIST